MNMTNTAEITDKKVNKIIDAARQYGWEVTVDGTEASGYLKVTATHPSPVDNYIGRVQATYWFDTDKKAWMVDGGYYWIQRNYGNNDGGFGASKTTSVKDVYDTLVGPNSPLRIAEKALRDAERAALREQAAADYKAEPDSPERAALRRALVSATKVDKAKKYLAEEYDRTWHNRLIDASFDAIAEDHYRMLAERCLEWEGQVDDKGNAITLEEAVTRNADSALIRCLKQAKGNSSRSTSRTSNMTEDAEVSGCSEFVAAFHPIYGGLASTWGRFTRDLTEVIDMDWLGRNTY